MQRLILPAIVTAFTFTTAIAGPLNLNPPNGASPGANPAAGSPIEAAPVQLVQGPNLGGGFLELLFGGPRSNAAPRYDPFQRQVTPAEPQEYQEYYGEQGQQSINPRYLKQVVDYDGKERSGTVIINTNERFLYLIQDNGTAIRYGIGVGRPGFTWAGVHHISSKREWPDWTPPAQMLKRRPDLPRHMEGGPENPLGARAMYLGSTLYRIHGSNEPWTIGTAVSSGCIRMRNEDVIDLYQRVKVGTKVVVI
jgi:lipoprotein-anchoring transpeptidase ErfK/SrfK